MPPVHRPPKKSSRVQRNATIDPELNRIFLLDGLTVRRRRHDRGWSPRELTEAIEEASFASSGLRRSISPNQLQAIEEREERISYELVLLLADGLGCDPADLIAEGELSARRRSPRKS